MAGGDSVDARPRIIVNMGVVIESSWIGVQTICFAQPLANPFLEDGSAHSLPFMVVVGCSRLSRKRAVDGFFLFVVWPSSRKTLNV